MRYKPRILLFLLFFILLLTSTAYAATASDIGSHWAKDQIQKWINAGLATGYPDGSFKPNNKINRAEFITLANKAFKKQTSSAKGNFNDVNPSDWFYREVVTAAGEGYITGYSDGTFRPNNNITRQEAAVITAKLLKLSSGSGEKAAFSDAGNIAQWAKASVDAVVYNKIMGGYPDGTFRPQESITRAEAIVTLEEALERVSDSGQVTVPPVSSPKEEGSSSGGGGGSGTPAEQPPSPPTVTLKVYEGSVVLTWTPISGVDYYKVKRGTKPAQFEIIAPTVNSTTYTDSSLDSSTTYYYVVTSVKKGRESIHSNVVMRLTAPKAPNLYGVLDGDTVMLNWTKPSGAESYTLYRSTKSGGPYYAIVENTLLNQFTDTVSANTTYYYVVKAFNSVGESEYSAELMIAPGMQQVRTFNGAMDNDGDGLTNDQELDLGTNINQQDSDRDCINDYDEIYVYFTDPLNPDTDSDGLYDGAEVALGTNPLVKNANVNTTRQTQSQDGKVVVIVRGDGNLSIAPLQVTYSDNVLLNSLQGLVGKPVDVTTGGFGITSADMSFTYDDTILGTVYEDDLTIFWVDPDNKVLVPLSNVKIDKSKKTVTGITNHFSTFLLGDKNMPVDLGYVDIVFTIDQSGSMSWNDPNHYRIKATKKFVLNMDELKNRAAIVQFSSSAIVRQGLTNDKNQLVQVLDTMMWASGGTNIKDAVTVSGREFNDVNKRKVIVFLTDGVDGYSTDEQILNEVKAQAAKGVIINTVALGSDSDTELLKKMAEYSNGGYFFVNNDPNLSQEDVEKQIELIYQKLTKQITLQKVTEQNLTPEQVRIVQFAEKYYGLSHDEALAIITPINTNLLTGNYMTQARDIHIESTGIGLDLERTYNSGLSGEKTIMGNGWRMNYDTRVLGVSNSGRVTASVLNVRETPAGKIITTVTWGTKLTYLQKNAGTANGLSWHFVQLPDGAKGYVAAMYVKNIAGSEVLYPTGTKITFEEENGVYTIPYETYDKLERDGTGYILTLKDQTRYLYNASGQLTTIKDKFGNEITVAYSNGKISSVTDPVGRSLKFTFANEMLTRVTDPLGRYVSFEYDAKGNLTKATDLDGKATTYNYYDKTNKLRQILDANWHQVVKNDYDPWGRVVRQYDGNSYIKYQLYNDLYENEDVKSFERYFINENGYESKISFNADQKPLKEVDTYGKYTGYEYFVEYNGWQNVSNLQKTDPLYKEYYENIKTVNRPTKEVVADKNGNKTTYIYDANKNLKEVSDPYDKKTFMDYNDKNSLISVKDKNGKITSYEYDGDGVTLFLEKDPLGKTIEYSYYTNKTVHGLVYQQKDKRGYKTTFEYDDKYNNLISVIDPTQNKSTFEYDVAGRKIKETNARHYSTLYEYDNMDRVIKVTDAMGEFTRNEYDAVGNHTAAIDKNGARTEYQYNDENQLIKVTDPLGGEVSYRYDPAGNKTRETDELGRQSSYAYDALNRLVKVTDAKGGETTYEYDPEGNTEKEVDALGRPTLYVYDKLNRLVSKTDAKGYQEAYTYDPAGNVLKIRNKNGFTTEYTYDELNRVKSKKNPNSGTSFYEYDNNGNPTQGMDAEGRITKTFYDSLNRPSLVRDALGNETFFKYDEIGNKVKEVDANKSETSFTYDNFNRLIMVTDALGNSNLMGYDSVGNNVYRVDKLGNRTEYSYDKMNRLVEIADPYGNITNYEYDKAGNKTGFTDPNGNTIIYDYDELNRLIRQTDKGGYATSYGYDAVGNKVSETSPGNNTVTYYYDKTNRLEKVKDPQNTETSYTYDGLGNLLSMKNGRGHITSYKYNNMGWLEKMTDPDTKYETYTYDKVGNMLTKVDRNGKTASYTYDALNRTVSKSVYGQTISYVFDTVGNCTEMTDATGKTTYIYDDLNRLIEKNLPDGSKMTFTYDTQGNRTSITDPAGNLTEYTYDKMNRLQTVRENGQDTVYDYDQNGNRKSLVYPNGTRTDYVYDHRNLLTRMTINIPNTTPDKAATTAAQIEKTLAPVQPDTNQQVEPELDTPIPATVTEIVYDDQTAPAAAASYIASFNTLEAGDTTAPEEETAITDPAAEESDAAATEENTESIQAEGINDTGTITDSVYGTPDISIAATIQPTVTAQVYNPQVIDLGNGLVTLIYTYEYGYDEDGNQVYKVEPKGRTDFTYDPLDRIKTVTGPDGVVVTYYYDGAGNRVSESVYGGGKNWQIDYTYSPSNRLTKAVQTGDISKITEYFYDKNGNQVLVVENEPENSVISEFEYDGFNRLVKVIKGGKTATYAYNGNGLRTEKTIDGMTTTFYYVGRDIILEKTSDGTTYHNTLGINLIARTDGTKLNYYLFNGHGDVVMMIAPDGTRENRYDYDIFGNLTMEEENGVKNPYRYSGYYYDSETKYYYLKARYYDPAIGRFLTEDTYKGNIDDPLSLHLYTYVQNNPVTYYDPSGNIVETVADVLSIGYSTYELFKKPSWGNAAFLAWDIAAAIIPCAPGSYVAKIPKAIKAVSKAEDIKDVSKVTTKAIKTADKSTDAKTAVKATSKSTGAAKTQASKKIAANTDNVNQSNIINNQVKNVQSGQIHLTKGTSNAATQLKDPYRRPTHFRKGVRDQVWEAAAKENQGLVLDPKTRKVINKNESWDMGHKPGYEFRKHQQSARERGISRKQFLDEYNNPDHYRPEIPSSNRSHTEELPDDFYLGD